MTEDLLHFIWKLRLLKPVSLCTTAGLPLAIVHPGEHNTHAGPDFANGRIVLGSTEWAGNIELHWRSSEWEQHRHHLDPAYDNVILHAVYEHDKEVFTSQKQPVPCLELRSFIDEGILEKYQRLYRNRREIACGEGFAHCAGHARTAWLERMLVERLEDKTALIGEVFEQTGRSWEDTFYLLLCRNFGFKVNAGPFYLLGRITPRTLLLKYAGSPLQREALLFGQAGLLETEFAEPYPRRLQNEYRFLRHKHSLSPMPGHSWKMLRMRPGNFPTIRIAQMAAFMAQYQHIFSQIAGLATAEEVKSLFRVSAGAWWNSHYTLVAPSPSSPKKLGESSIENILLNTVCPMLFFYGRERGAAHLCEKALDWYATLSAENNQVTRHYEQLGFRPGHAGHSQALLQLHKNYCSARKCLDCGIGSQLLQGSKALSGASR
jgi:hypothetical protein